MLNEIFRRKKPPIAPGKNMGERSAELKSRKASQEKCRVERELFLKSLTQADRDRVSFIINTVLLFSERTGVEEIVLLAQTGFLNETMEPLIHLNATTSKTEEAIDDLSKNIHDAITEHEGITHKIFEMVINDGNLDIAKTLTAQRILITCTQTELPLIDFLDQRAARDGGGCILLNSSMQFITGTLPTPSRHDTPLDI